MSRDSPEKENARCRQTTECSTAEGWSSEGPPARPHSGMHIFHWLPHAAGRPHGSLCGSPDPTGYPVGHLLAHDFFRSLAPRAASTWEPPARFRPTARTSPVQLLGETPCSFVFYSYP